jgi:DNA-directed RNA polymerase subunit RPC12/RpoP
VDATFRTAKMKTAETPALCPDCRSRDMRRRKRSGLRLYLASIFGKWPYRCDACGSEFFLNRRHVNQRSKAARGSDPRV